MRRIGSLTLLLVLCVTGFQQAAQSAETSSLAVDAVTVGTTVSVSGTLALGDDATGPTKVGTDGANDATVAKLGYDLGDAFITPNLAAKKLTLSINVNDGLPGVDGISPAAGYVWPLMVNGTDTSQWLAAGTFVSGWPPKTEKWFELCSTASGSYTCGNPVAGTMSASQISWTVPFNVAGTATYGSTFEVGAATPGAPGVIPWAFASGGSTYDTVDGVSGYKIPGKVEVGIAPVGTLEQNVNYSASAAFVPATSKFAVTAPKPAAGSYTVFVRSCFGLLDAPTCLTTTQPLTV